MSDLARLVEASFQLRGYTLEPSPGGHVLRFRRGTEHLAVRVRDGKDPVPATVAHEVAETLPALGHAILVCLGDVGHEAREVLERGGIDVWTREKTIHEIGRTFLEAAEHRALPALGTTPAPPAPVPEPTFAAPEPEPAPLPLLAPPPATPSLWARAPAPPAPEPVAAPTPPPATPLAPSLVQWSPPTPPPAAPSFAAPTFGAPTLAAGPPLAAVEGSIIAAAVDRENALKIGVGRLLRVDKASLELVPLHAFRYACKLEAKGAPSVSKSGLLAVDAVTGTVRELAEPLFGPIPTGAQRLEVGLPELDATPLVKHRIVEMHTQKMRVKSNLRNTLMVEDKTVRPDPRTIQLDSQGLWWLPVWHLEGQNGSLRVNGATGTIEDEKLKRAFAQSAEFL